MTTINHVSNQAPAFKGVKGFKKPNLQQYAEAHKLASESNYANLLMERLCGVAEAIKGRSTEELKETVLRETMLGNTEFVKGINDVLAKNAAKNGYKPQ